MAILLENRMTCIFWVIVIYSPECFESSDIECSHPEFYTAMTLQWLMGLIWLLMNLLYINSDALVYEFCCDIISHPLPQEVRDIC